VKNLQLRNNDPVGEMSDDQMVATFSSYMLKNGVNFHARNDLSNLVANTSNMKIPFMLGFGAPDLRTKEETYGACVAGEKARYFAGSTLSSRALLLALMLYLREEGLDRTIPG
jgi:hypothetical protein